MRRNNNIIFLYAELTPYLIGCLKFFLNKFPDFNIHVVYDKKFEKLIIDHSNNLKLIQKDKFNSKLDLLKFCNDINPTTLIISGRMYSDYLFIAKKFKGKCIRVTAQDTTYTPTLKQYFIKCFSSILYKQYFDKFWGVGLLQKKFALNIGFKDEDIKDGFYVADKMFFDKSKIFSSSHKNLKILFIGRLVKEKNILRLASVVDEINKADNAKHKLKIIGSGYLKENLIDYKCVEFLGPLHQDKIILSAHKCDVFCLPSIYEPWGVVTHEMAALGMPILISKRCGSSEDLVSEGVNGYKFDPTNKSSIKEALRKFILLTNDLKKEFSLNSVKISKKINHNIWNKTLLSLLNNKI